MLGSCSYQTHDSCSPQVPTAIPLIYHLDAELKPIRSERSSGMLPTDRASICTVHDIRRSPPPPLPRVPPYIGTGMLSGYFLKEATEANDPQKSFELTTQAA